MKKSKLLKYIALVILVPFIIVAGLAAYSSMFRLSMNFFEVDPGKFYRSAQLTPMELDEKIKRYGVKTVINLRGEAKGSDWYDQEVAVTEKNGARHISFNMRDDMLPHKQEIIGLLEAYKTVERPILIHCRAGADRTGEEAALYAIEYMNQTKEKALEQLSIKYGHFDIAKPAKRHFVEIYQGLDWVKDHYNPCSPDLISEYDKRYCQ